MARPKGSKNRSPKEATLTSAKTSLKNSAPEKDRVLTVRLGVKKLVLPVTAKLAQSGEYLFLSFPASTEIYRMDGKTLAPIENDEEAGAAMEALATPRRRGGRRKKAVEIAPEVHEALANLPAGHRIGYDAEGNAKLVKTRPRRRKGAKAEGA